MIVVLDSGGLSRLAERSTAALALLRAMRAAGRWPATVPTAVLVESLTGSGPRDARVNRLLKACRVEPVQEATARRAALLRSRARAGSAVDALVVAAAEPGGVVLTSDPHDVGALAHQAAGVRIEAV